MKKRSKKIPRLFVVAISLLSLCLASLAQAQNLSGEGQDQLQATGQVDDFKLTCEEAKFIRFLNIYRTSKGFPAVQVSRAAVEATRWHAQDMIDKNYFDHTEPNGRRFSARAAAFNYKANSENIAGGNKLAAKTFCQWKNSPGHDKNMLKPTHVTTGIGNVQGGRLRSYWSSNFGKAATDTLRDPLTLDADCVLPTTLPVCPPKK